MLKCKTNKPSTLPFFYIEGPKEKKKEESINGDNNNDDNNTTNRCIDCSRESWKTKRFTNIGMNTEISCNPSKELDLSKITSISNNTTNNTNGNQQQPLPSPQSTNNSEKHNFAAKPPTQQQQQQHSPSSAPHSNSRHNPITGLPFNIKNEYQPSQHHPSNAKQMRKNGGHHHEEERALTSPTYGVEMFAHASPQLRYPSLEAPPAHYERFVQPHGWLIDRPGRYEQVTRASHGTISVSYTHLTLPTILLV